MIKAVVILAIICQCVWLAKSDDSSLLHFRSADGQVEQHELQDRVWRTLSKASPRDLQWTDSTGVQAVNVETQDEPTAVTTTETRAAKIDFTTLLITILTNVFWAVLNYMTQNPIGIFYNAVNIIEALLLFFFGS